MRARFALFLGLAAAVTGPALAQQPPRPGQPQMERRQAAPRAMPSRMPAGSAAEMVLRLREQLNLTDAQVTRLETLRQEGVTARRERMGEMLDLRSQLQAGRITREQLQERLRTRAEAAPGGQQPMGERVRAVLTDQQRVRLAELQVEQLRRQVAAQRGGRPMLRGGMGRGMGPAQGPRVRARIESPGRMGPAAREMMLRRMQERRAATPPEIEG